MDELSSINSMNEQDRQISEIIAEERCAISSAALCPTLRTFEDIVQEVFYQLVEANRLLMPIDYVTGWLFRVARNRITELFRKKKPETLQRYERRGRRRRVAADRRSAAESGKADIAKPMQGLGSGVVEVALPFRGDAFRVVYAVQLGDDLWVIHAFRRNQHGASRHPNMKSI